MSHESYLRREAAKRQAATPSSVTSFSLPVTMAKNTTSKRVAEAQSLDVYRALLAGESVAFADVVAFVAVARGAIRFDLSSGSPAILVAVEIPGRLKRNPSAYAGEAMAPAVAYVAPDSPAIGQLIEREVVRLVRELVAS